jgi:hypothetical protein
VSLVTEYLCHLQKEMYLHLQIIVYRNQCLKSFLVLYLHASHVFLPERSKQTVMSSYCKCNCNCGVHRVSAEASCLPVQGTRYPTASS